jgi:hypothetical protein
MRHYADLIVRASSEVFLATNYWESSSASSLIAKALRELSRRVGERNTSEKGQAKKVVVKIMYDRGTLHQVVKNHFLVDPSEWKSVNLPTKDEIPNVDLEVVNYHRPVLG